MDTGSKIPPKKTLREQGFKAGALVYDRRAAPKRRLGKIQKDVTGPASVQVFWLGEKNEYKRWEVVHADHLLPSSQIPSGQDPFGPSSTRISLGLPKKKL